MSSITVTACSLRSTQLAKDHNQPNRSEEGQEQRSNHEAEDSNKGNKNDDQDGHPSDNSGPDGPDPSDGDNGAGPSDPDNDDKDNNSNLPRGRSAEPLANPVFANINIKELIRAVMSSSKGNSSESRNLKVNTPNKFSGAKRHECNQFVLACKLYFRAKHLRLDEDKTTFAGSYLTGAARRWFDTYPTDHSVLLNWATFVAELKKRHGKQDPHGLAIRRISALQMKDSDHILDFLVKFAECQVLINWEDKAGSVLLVRFYDMLPCRLKQMFMLSSKRHLNLDLYKLRRPPSISIKTTGTTRRTSARRTSARRLGPCATRRPTAATAPPARTGATRQADHRRRSGPTTATHPCRARLSAGPTLFRLDPMAK